MPVISTSAGSLGSPSPGLIGGAFQGLGNLLESAFGVANTQLGQTVIGSLLQRNVPVAMPGGSLLQGMRITGQQQSGQFPDPRTLQVQQAGLPLQLGIGALGAAAGSLFGGGGGGGCVVPVTTQSTRLPTTFEVPFADAAGNMKTVVYRKKGRVLLYADDLRACKAVKKIGRLAKSATGGR